MESALQPDAMPVQSAVDASVATVPVDEGAATAKAIYIPLTKIAIPQPVANAMHAMSHRMQDARKFALRVTPAPLVNMNSNINGMLHVAAELAMFKASGVAYLRPRDGKPVNYMIDPVRNLYRAFTGADKDKALQNHWSTRSTMSGFAAWTLGTVVPDKINKQEDVDQLEASAQNSPIRYYARRMFEAIHFGNPNTKRQQIGLGVTVAGVFSFLSGFTNVNTKTRKRFFNWSHTAGGAITALAGTQLLFGLSDKQGWQNYGNVTNCRIPLLLLSIHKKHKNNDRWGTYALGQALFQGAAIYSYLYGGAQKLPDGTIIEATTSHGHKNMPSLLKHKPKDLTAAEQAVPSAEGPQPRISDASTQGKAMPEQQAQTGVAVASG